MDAIDRIKEIAGQGAEQTIAAGMGLERQNKKYRCPNRAGHKNNDKNPSMAWDPKALQFYCFTCNNKIDIYGYHKEYEGKSHKDILAMYDLEQPAPAKEIFKLEPITRECIDYLLTRKLTEETISDFGLKTYEGKIAFPYYNSAGTVVGVKYRKPIKNVSLPKYVSITGSEFGLFNKQNVRGEEIIICEGEIDCMIIHQCGYKNVTSVGTGAGACKGTYEKEKNYLSAFKSIIIISDNDAAGAKMDKDSAEVFGVKAKIVNKKLFREKDVNLEYYRHGKEAIVELIESARVKIEGLRHLDKDPYKGMEAVKGRYIPTGIRTLDYAINDLAPQCVTLVTGRSNDGKSTFVNQVMVNAVDKGNKVFLVSGEGIQEILINNFYKAVIGRDPACYDFKQINKRKYKEPKPEVLAALQRWHKGKFTLFNKGDSKLKTMDQLFELIELEIKTNRHDLVVLDNVMSILSVEKASEKLERQADFVQRCCDLAKMEGMHIIIVLHPNKTTGKGSDIEFENISGTLDMANKADNIIVVSKAHTEEQKLNGDGIIALKKNRYFPDLPRVDVHYEEETGLLLEIIQIANHPREILQYGCKWRQFLEGEVGDMGEVPPWEQ